VLEVERHIAYIHFHFSIAPFSRCAAPRTRRISLYTSISPILSLYPTGGTTPKRHRSYPSTNSLPGPPTKRTRTTRPRHYYKAKPPPWLHLPRANPLPPPTRCDSRAARTCRHYFRRLPPSHTRSVRVEQFACLLLRHLHGTEERAAEATREHSARGWRRRS